MAETLDPSLAVTAFLLKDASNWWNNINDSLLWQDRIFHVLSILYGIVSVVALVILFLGFFCLDLLIFVDNY